MQQNKRSWVLSKQSFVRRVSRSHGCAVYKIVHYMSYDHEVSYRLVLAWRGARRQIKAPSRQRVKKERG